MFFKSLGFALGNLGDQGDSEDGGLWAPASASTKGPLDPYFYRWSS